MNSALGIVIGLAVLSCIFWILGAGVCRLMGRKEDPVDSSKSSKETTDRSSGIRMPRL